MKGLVLYCISGNYGILTGDTVFPLSILGGLVQFLLKNYKLKILLAITQCVTIYKCLYAILMPYMVTERLCPKQEGFH